MTILTTVERGEYNEHMLWSLLQDEEVGASLGTEHVCSHAIPLEHPHDYLTHRLPHAIKAYNEGGFNSTVLCVDCVLEVLRQEGIVRP